jgi:hypothetical protein
LTGFSSPGEASKKFFPWFSRTAGKIKKGATSSLAGFAAGVTFGVGKLIGVAVTS